jgi:putative addiction module killer protein
MLVILRSAEFDTLLSALVDAKGKARILVRLRSATLGNFGDCEAVGEGVSEMCVHVGPGYRVYFTRAERTVYLLLTGGDKSTQSKDIARAKTMARAIRETKR